MTNPTLDCLNSAFAADPAAMAALVSNRVPCNAALADHPFVVVDQHRTIVAEGGLVGMLGVLNGVLSAHGLPVAVAEWTTNADDEWNKLVGFCEYCPAGHVEAVQVGQVSEWQDNAGGSSRQCGEARLTVYRYTDEVGGWGWAAYCYGMLEHMRLASQDLEQAKCQATALLQVKLQEALAAITGSQP